MSDVGDQATQLASIMESEAVYSQLHGGGGEGSDDGLSYPLEDLEELVAQEDADDASDDAFHAGGMEPEPWVSAEQSAMHITNGDGVIEENDPEDPPHHLLTPEDETLLGIDPYDDALDE